MSWTKLSRTGSTLDIFLFDRRPVLKPIYHKELFSGNNQEPTIPVDLRVCPNHG